MKNFKSYIATIFTLFLFIYSSSLSAEKWKREASGFSETESFEYGNNKVVLYKNNTIWKDTKGNYGTSKCYGLIVYDDETSIIDYKMYCNFADQDKEKFTHQYFRNIEFSAGVGESILIGGEGKWKNLIGLKCTYAIDYLMKALFLVEKCS